MMTDPMSLSIRGHACVQLVFAVFLTLLGVSADTGALERMQSVVEVELSGVQISLAGVDDLKRVASRGFTPSYRPTAGMLAKLSNDGFQSMRLINVEWDTVARLKDGRLTGVQWSRKLERELQTCRQLGLIPHIVVGQIAPHGVQASGKGNERRGVRDWSLYRQYLRLLFDHVVREWGFTETVWEVGNEMDNPRFNWLSSEPLTAKLDPDGYRLYLDLYRLIADEAERFRRANPDIRLSIGGPALTQNSMNYPTDSPRNWLVHFARDVAAQGIPCDFLSMHFYGSAGSRRELVQRIGLLNAVALQAGRPLPLWITEWGASAFFQYANENFLPDAGAFSLDFIRTAADNGVANMLFIAATRHTDVDKSGPALLMRDGSPSHAYRGIELIGALQGERQPCRTHAEGVSCIASRSATSLQVLVWHSDWTSRRLGDRFWLKQRKQGVRNIDISFTGTDTAVTAWRPSRRLAADSAGWHVWDGGQVELPDNSYMALEYHQASAALRH